MQKHQDNFWDDRMEETRLDSMEFSNNPLSAIFDQKNFLHKKHPGDIVHTPMSLSLLFSLRYQERGPTIKEDTDSPTPFDANTRM